MGIETNSFIFGWNRPVTGREGHAAELFATAVNYWEKQQKNGRIESYEPVFMQSHGGDLNGFFFIKGTYDNLNKLQTEDEFVDLLFRANHCLTGVGIIPCYRGNNTIQDAMTRWTKLIPR